MAHSIEARVPFLDHRLVEFAFRLPGEFKVRGVDTKAILREAMRGVLPEPIRTRKDKIGFRAEPSATWALAERHRDSLLGNRTEHEEQWFDAGAVASLLDGRVAAPTRSSCSGGSSTRSCGCVPSGRMPMPTSTEAVPPRPVDVDADSADRRVRGDRRTS